MTEQKRGGQRANAGRKPGSTIDNPKSKQKAQRYTVEEAEALDEAAVIAGVTVSEFIRLAALRRAIVIRR